MNLFAKKKKRLPFQGKVTGGNARRRPDRAAKRAEGGPTVKILPPQTYEDYQSRMKDEPKDSRIMMGGQTGFQSLRDRFNTGRRIAPAPGSARGGGVGKRQAGGDVPLPRPDPRNPRMEKGLYGEKPRKGLPPEKPPGWSYKSGGVLSAKQRQALPSSSFALPGKGKGPGGAGAGSYPIPDPSHARNALARVSQHGSSSEKAAVRAKVKAKYPSIGQSK